MSQMRSETKQRRKIHRQPPSSNCVHNERQLMLKLQTVVFLLIISARQSHRQFETNFPIARKNSIELERSSGFTYLVIIFVVVGYSK